MFCSRSRAELLLAPQGFFGFKPFTEMWCGRWAMMGFVMSIVGEATTGEALRLLAPGRHCLPQPAEAAAPA